MIIHWPEGSLRMILSCRRGCQLGQAGTLSPCAGTGTDVHMEGSILAGRPIATMAIAGPEMAAKRL
jgi:hypothetical protein